VMRPTWHFVTPEDIRWLLALTAPRVAAKLATMDKKLELDRAVLLRSYTVIVDALRGGKQLTRTELASALAKAGIIASNLRLTNLVMHAELDAVICSGPRQGKQFTYMLLDERAPQAKSLGRDEALVELIRRYLTGHGPATVHDFAWWSGLTITDAKSGLAALGSEVNQVEIEGKKYFHMGAITPPLENNPVVFLLPTYDEFLVGFATFDESRRGGRPPTRNGTFEPPLIADGRAVGYWRRTIRKGIVLVEIVVFESLNAENNEALIAAAKRYGNFLGMPVELLFISS